MLRKLVVRVTLALTLPLSFAVATYARAGTLLGHSTNQVGLAEQLPISASPPLALTQPERIKLDDLIGSSRGASKVGITEDSFNAVRSFPVGVQEQMYVIPGTKGACLVLGNGATCGSLTASHQIGLIRVDPSTGAATAAGITDDSVRKITENIDGTTATVQVTQGTYRFDKDAGLRVSGGQTHMSPHVSVSTD
jgi:hypothetical protein